MITLNDEYAKLAMQALDIAVKAGGLNAAVRLLPVAQEIERQLTATVNQPTIPIEET